MKYFTPGFRLNNNNCDLSTCTLHTHTQIQMVIKNRFKHSFSGTNKHRFQICYVEFNEG